MRARSGEGRVMSRDMAVQWHEAWRVSSGETGEAVLKGEGLAVGSHGERPPSRVSLMCLWCHSLGNASNSGAWEMTPVATSHSHCSGGADEEGRLTRKTWHPHVEQKYLVELDETE